GRDRSFHTSHETTKPRKDPIDFVLRVFVADRRPCVIHRAPRMQTFGRRLLIVATLLTLGVAIQQYYRVTLKLQDPLGGHINDFDRWMIMTPQFIHEGAGYVDDRLPTPPITLMVLAPFTALSRPLAQFVWVCVKLPLACLVL